MVTQLYVIVAVLEDHRLDTTALQQVEIRLFPEVAADTVGLPVKICQIRTVLADRRAKVVFLGRHFFLCGFSKRINPDIVN